MAGPAKARRLGNADLAGSIAAAAGVAKSRIEALDAGSVDSVSGSGDDPFGTDPGIGIFTGGTIVYGMYPVTDPTKTDPFGLPDPNDPTGMGGLEL